MRMYLIYVYKLKLRTKILSIKHGYSNGIKKIIFLVWGKDAYNFLKTEVGVHRQVKVSSFKSGSRRHTSFSSIWVIPYVFDKYNIKIPTNHLKVDTFKSSGAGGQHVNKTNSGIRITHIPTKIVSVSSTERSQKQNRILALSYLKSKIRRFNKKKTSISKSEGEIKKYKASFGSQVRNYILFPYKLIKDPRTLFELHSFSDLNSIKVVSFTLSLTIWKYL